MSLPQNVLDAMAWFGLVAVVNADFSGADFIEISDALLAAPLPIIAVAATISDPGDVIAALRARHGANLTIGASHVQTPAVLDAVCAAGAQFVLGGAPDAGLVTRARVVYIPHCTSTEDLHTARRLGCAMVLRVLDDAAAPMLPGAWQTVPEMPQVLVAGAVTAANMAALAQSPVAAVAVGYAPIAPGRWSAAALITQARAMRRAWDAARTG